MIASFRVSLFQTPMRLKTGRHINDKEDIDRSDTIYQSALYAICVNNVLMMKIEISVLKMFFKQSSLLSQIDYNV